MVSLLTGFFTGAVNQLNANFDANQKIKEDRDRRREEMADQLSLYLKKGEYDKVNERDKFDYEFGTKEKAKIAEEQRGLDIYGKQKSIDLGTAKSLDDYKTGNEIRKKKQELQDQTQSTLDLIRSQMGDLNGGLGKTSSSSSEAAPERIQNLKAKAAWESLQGVPGVDKIAKGQADSLNTKETIAAAQAKYIGKPLEFAGGGDVTKDLQEMIKGMNIIQGPMAPSPYFDYKKDKSSVTQQTPEHTKAMADTAELALTLGDKTRTQDSSLGVDTNYSSLTPRQTNLAAFAIVRGKGILMDPSTSPEEKKQAAKDIDSALKVTKKNGGAVLTDPSLSSFFDENFKGIYNQYADKPKQTPAPGMKSYRVRDPKTGRTGNAQASNPEELLSQGLEIIQ